MSEEIWLKPEIINWTQILLDSFASLLEYELIYRQGDKQEQAEALFKANFVVVSHGTEEDPVLNYGNQTALELWAMDWSDFVQTPSRLTAEPINREKREFVLKQVAKKGYIDNYNGVRISSVGQKFEIEQTIIWNLVDGFRNKCGQAATFYDWKML